MNIQRCANGHYYNIDKYTECPHCNPNAERNSPTASAADKFVKDDGKKKDGNTVGINWDSGSGNNYPQMVEPQEEPVGRSGRKQESINTITIFDDNYVPRVPSEEKPINEETSGGSSLEDEIKNANNTPDDGKTKGFFQMLADTTSEKNSADPTPAQHISSEPVAGWLVCVGGTHFGESFSVFGKKNSVGRNSSNSIVIPKDTTVSREKHAFVTYDTKGRRFYLEPGGANVYLNENLVMTPREIHIYDIIELGDGNAKFVFIPLCGDNFDWKDYIK